MTRVFDGEGCRVILDDVHYPLLISRWEGTLTSQAARDSFVAVHEVFARAQARGELVWSVVDAIDTQRPDALTRKTLQEINDDGEQRYPGVLRKPTYAAMTNVIIRGAVTAMRWISTSIIDLEAHATMEEALTAALASMRAAGIEPELPLDPATYDTTGAKGKSA